MMAAETNPSARLVAPNGEGNDVSNGVSESSGRQTRFFFGVFLLMIVVTLWVFSSWITQLLYDNPDVNYPKPTALTTLSTATAAIFALPQLLRSGGCLKGPSLREEHGSEPVTFATVMLISLNWFFCQWTFNVSLGHTALATNTMLSSTSVVWSFTFTVLMGLRRCSLMGPVCIVFAISGIALATFGKAERVDPTAPVDDALGTAFALGSALMYGIFSNQLALKVKQEQMTQVWGFVGVSSVFIGAVMMAIGHVTGLETFEMPSGKAFSIMLLNGFLGTSISDYIWAQGVLLTSPLVANISLNVTIPVSLVVDTVLLHQHNYPWTSPLGGVLIFCGVVVAAFDEVKGANSEVDARESISMSEVCASSESPGEPGWQQM